MELNLIHKILSKIGNSLDFIGNGKFPSTLITYTRLVYFPEQSTPSDINWRQWQRCYTFNLIMLRTNSEISILGDIRKTVCEKCFFPRSDQAKPKNFEKRQVVKFNLRAKPRGRQRYGITEYRLAVYRFCGSGIENFCGTVLRTHFWNLL